MRPDNSELLVNFDEFVAQAGPGTRPTDWRKNCNLEAQVDVPAGYTFTITGASYFGYADLSGGATAMFGSRYYFGAGPGPDFGRRPVTGSPWVQTDTAVATPASCDGVRQLTLDTELRVTKGTSRFPVWVQLSHDDKRFSAAYTLRWQRC